MLLLYLQPALGVSKSSRALLYVILSPVGPYFKTGTFSPVSLLADPSFVRAWPGGCGDSKMGGYVTKKTEKNNDSTFDTLVSVCGTRTGGRGALPVVDYMERVCPKGGSFLGCRYIKG